MLYYDIYNTRLIWFYRSHNLRFGHEINEHLHAARLEPLSLNMLNKGVAPPSLEMIKSLGQQKLNGADDWADGLALLWGWFSDVLTVISATCLELFFLGAWRMTRLQVLWVSDSICHEWKWAVWVNDSQGTRGAHSSESTEHGIQQEL